jgi:hypothetical protein
VGGSSGGVAVGVPFLISGIAKIFDFPGSIAEVRGLTGLEPAALFAVLVILTQSALCCAGVRYAPPSRPQHVVFYRAAMFFSFASAIPALFVSAPSQVRSCCHDCVLASAS